MTKLSVCVATAALLSSGACASNEASERPIAAAPYAAEPEPIAAAPVQTAALPTPETDARAQQARGAETRMAQTGATQLQTTDRDAHAAAERAATEPTALDRGDYAADLTLARKIRQAVMGDDSLSFSAKNVKIIADQGEVTLRGGVASDAEKHAIDTYAKQIAGPDHVHNELEMQ
jgi:hypothetical protein